MQDAAISAIAHTIQLAVAPVFLLTGVGAVLGVLTNRLARIIDRSRKLDDRAMGITAVHSALIHDELRALSRRATLINHAITACTTAALLVCAVIAALFLGAVFAFDTSNVVAVFFVLAMVALFFGFLSFLREIFVAIRSLRIGTSLPAAD